MEERIKINEGDLVCDMKALYDVFDSKEIRSLTDDLLDNIDTQLVEKLNRIITKTKKPIDYDNRWIADFCRDDDDCIETKEKRK